MNNQNSRPSWFPATAALASLLVAASVLAVDDGPDRAPPEKYTRPYLIRFEGDITPLREHFVYRKLEIAQRKNADLVVIEIDSPGGYVESSLDLADRLLNIDWAHTVAFVPREAMSGAAIMALGCDEIVLAPDARFGDAGPIFLGEDAMFRHAPEKLRSMLAVRVRELAEATGRPPALAEAMVDMDLVVHRVRNQRTGEETYLSDHEIEADEAPDNWEKLRPVHESRAKHFLTVSGRRAVELRLAEGNAATPDELKGRFGLEEDFVVLRPSGVDTAVVILNIPLVTILLLLVGLVSLYIEFSAPGLGVGGVVAALCFALFFWSKFLGGTAVWLEVVLFLLGVLLLLIEIFVTPGFGFAGITGLVLIAASLLMAGQDFVIPSTQRELNATLRGLLVLVVTGFGFVVGAVAISRMTGSVPILSWMRLELPADHETPSGDGKQPPASHWSDRFPIGVGDWGVTESPLRPAGKAIFDDHYVDVVADGSFVEAGKQVRVIEIAGNRVVVREIQEPA